MNDYANKNFLNRRRIMKLNFPTRNRGRKTTLQKITTHLQNFIYHLRNGKNLVQAWGLAGKTF